MKTQAMTAAEEIKALKAQLKEAQSKESKATLPSKVNVKIGEKGSLNFYGLGRMPYCLYLSQLIRLRDAINSPELAKFIEDNKDQLAVKEKAE